MNGAAAAEAGAGTAVFTDVLAGRHVTLKYYRVLEFRFLSISPVVIRNMGDELRRRAYRNLNTRLEISLTQRRFTRNFDQNSDIFKMFSVRSM